MRRVQKMASQKSGLSGRVKRWREAGSESESKRERT